MQRQLVKGLPTPATLRREKSRRLTKGFAIAGAAADYRRRNYARLLARTAFSKLGQSGSYPCELVNCADMKSNDVSLSAAHVPYCSSTLSNATVDLVFRVHALARVVEKISGQFPAKREKSAR
jgi:hypothetical protein